MALSPKREKRLQEVHMNAAGEYASMSYATRAQVGALIVKGDNILSYAWNGMPHGFPNDELEYEEAGDLVTNPIGLHAESNALMKLVASGEGSSTGADMYVTMSPCLDCAKLMIQAKIKRVFYRDAYRKTESLDLLKRANIEVIQLPKASDHE